MPYPYQLTDLQNDVLSRLNESTDSSAGELLPGDSDTPTITTLTTITQYLNEAQEDLARACWPIADSGTVSLATGTGTIALSGLTVSSGNALWVARGVAWNGVSLTRCSRSTLELWYPTWNTDATGTPLYWFDQGEIGIMIYPAPPSTQTLTVTGLAVPKRLVNSTDVATGLLPDLAKLLVFYAAAMIGVKNLQNAVLQARAPIWRQEYEAGKAALLARLWAIDPALARAHYAPPVPQAPTMNAAGGVGDNGGQ